MESPTTTQLANSFKQQRASYDYTKDELAWIRVVFGAIMKVSKSHSEFTVDAIWAEIDRLRAKDKLPVTGIDHRILGPMIRHMVSLGLLGASGYYTKSTRRGGGSRPVTIWKSFMVDKVAVAA